MPIGVPWFGGSMHLEAAATFKLRGRKPVEGPKYKERFVSPYI